MIIEPVIAEQISILQYIARKSFFDTFVKFNTKEDMECYLNNQLSIEQLTLEFNNPQSQFYMARIDQEYVGYIKLNWGSAQQEFQKDNGLEIERIYVLQQFHRLKVGQALYEQALCIARQQKFDYVWLGVWEHNQGAISFYKKNGFIPFGQHEFKLGADVQIDILMRKEMMPA